MIAVDTNILIAAHRGEHPRHRAATDRLVAVLEGEAPWALPIFCVGEFLRVVTHSRVFSPASSLESSLGFVERLLQSPGSRLLTPGPRFWACLRSACLEADTRGNLVFDAQIAAVCVEHGATRLLTEDRDFSRFDAIIVERL